MAVWKAFPRPRESAAGLNIFQINRFLQTLSWSGDSRAGSCDMRLDAGSPDKRIALQIAGRRTEISELDECGERTPRTQIVAIGAPINAKELSNKFDACIEQY